MEPQPTVLVQKEFIERIDTIRRGLKDFRSEFAEFKTEQEQHLGGVREHLDRIEDKIGTESGELRAEILRVEEKFDAKFVALADLVELVLEEVRAIGVGIDPDPGAVKLEI